MLGCGQATVHTTGTLQKRLGVITWFGLFRHFANVFSLSFKEFKFLFLIVIATCAILTPLHRGVRCPRLERLAKTLQKKIIKYAQKRPFLCNFNVCSYLIHRTFQNENLLYYTYYQTYHFKMLVMTKKSIIIDMYLYSHDIYKESMHNKRFIILYRLLCFCLYGCVFISLILYYYQFIVSKMIFIGDPHNLQLGEAPKVVHSRRAAILLVLFRLYFKIGKFFWIYTLIVISTSCQEVQ